MIDTLNKGLKTIGLRQDLAVVVLLVTAIMMMILPLPTWLVDVLVAINIAGAVLLLMMALYLKSPLDFSTLPAVILIITIFRLALSITTTRLILLQADAGEIIATFGQFVVAGEIIVGLVIFLIITIVQFVVITKGSERVAEVSARFTLDGLPGKQMSIDSDLRNGDIDANEARSRRRTIQQESQFFGAMDGAMKFVKGDAIAGLVIVAVNLIGGIAIGMSQGRSAGEAVEIYSLLTVGDGLAAQLPALFVSLAAGSVITRVATDENKNLGADIAREMSSSKYALRVAGGIVLLMMFIPGFPWEYFLILALGLFSVSFADELRALFFGDKEVEVETGPIDVVEALGIEKSPFSIRVPPGTLSSEHRKTLVGNLVQQTRTFSDQLGIGILPAKLVEDASLPADAVHIELEEVPVGSYTLRPGMLGVDASAEVLRLANIPFETVDETPAGFEAFHWVGPDAREAVRAEGLHPLVPAEIVEITAIATQHRFASQCIGVQETRAALEGMGRHYPDLVNEVRQMMPLNKLAEVFRRLVDEGIPLRNHRLVVEALVEWGAKEQDPVVLTEYVRTALKRQICHSIVGDDRVLPIYLLDGQLEETIRAAIRQTTVGEYLALDDAVGAAIVQAIGASVREPEEGGSRPVIACSLDVRRFVRSILINNGLTNIAVLSYQDLSNEFVVTPVTTIMLPPSALPQAAE